MKYLILKYIIPLLFLMLSAGFAKAASLDIWYELPASGHKEYWIVAFEENDFIKDKIGHWLPLSIIETKGEKVRCSLRTLERSENSTTFTFLLQDTAGAQILTGLQGFRDRGPDDTLPVLFYREGQDTILSLRMGDGTERKILVRRGDSILDLKSSMSISLASPFWKWDEVTIKHFGDE
jgi:hypothetical protein